MSDDEERDLAAEIDELYARQEWAEESIAALAEAVQRLVEEATPATATRATRQVVTSRIGGLLNRVSSRPPQE